MDPLNHSDPDDDPEPVEEFGEGLWGDIESGAREPVDIIYVRGESVDLEEIEEFGAETGWWTLRVVPTVKAAIAEHRRAACELMILLGIGSRGASTVATEFPELPLSVAKLGGWDGFPSGFPPQVVVAQWAAPRPGEFADAVEEALEGVAARLVYAAAHPGVEVTSAISADLFARLAKYPEERFSLDPRVFEETVAELLARMGYDVKLTPRSGDKGRDVIAAYQTPAAPILMLVECKRYARHRPVGVEPVTRVWSRLFDDHANMGMVVTTSHFAPVATEVAESRGYQLSLKDGEQYIAWLRELRNR